MRRRQLLLLSGVLALLMVWGWLLLRPKPRATKANFDRIQKGMTAKEVEAILGPGVYRKRKPSAPPPIQTRQDGVAYVWRVKDEAVLGWWLGEDMECAVEYDHTEGPIEQWRVASKCSVQEPLDSSWKRLHRWCERAFEAVRRK